MTKNYFKHTFCLVYFILSKKFNNIHFVFPLLKKVMILFLGRITLKATHLLVMLRTFIVIKLRPLISVTILIYVTSMYWQKIDLSNGVSLMKIVRVVYDSRLERQYIPLVLSCTLNHLFKVILLQKVFLMIFSKTCTFQHGYIKKSNTHFGLKMPIQIN